MTPAPRDIARARADLWRRVLAMPGLPPLAKVVWWALTDRMRSPEWASCPGLRRIGADVGRASHSRVSRAVAQLVAAGLVCVVPGGAGRRAVYTLPPALISELTVAAELHAARRRDRQERPHAETTTNADGPGAAPACGDQKAPAEQDQQDSEERPQGETAQRPQGEPASGLILGGERPHAEHKTGNRTGRRDKEKPGGAAADPWRAALWAMEGDTLKTETFRVVWGEWTTYRREIRKPTTSATIKAQVAMLEGLGHDAAVESIRASIRNGWQGLFPPKGDARAKASGGPRLQEGIVTRRFTGLSPASPKVVRA